MPTYQYRCKKCSEEFEKHQSFSDDSTPKCPNCGTRSKKFVTKVFGRVGIAFKGDGFYKNDSAPKKTKTTASSNGSSGSGDTTKTAGSDSASNGSSDNSSKSDSSKSDTSAKTTSTSSKSD